jgi:hypothetical protein
MRDMLAHLRRTESANDRARRLWDGDPRSTALALLKELLGDPEPAGAIEVLLPWIVDRVRAANRSGVRHVEDEAFTDPLGRPDRVARSFRTQTGALPALTNLELLLTLPVLVPAAGRATQAVAWGDMTIADHEARIGMLGKAKASLQQTIARHEWSVSVIRKHNVTCLRDIDFTMLRAELPK